MRKLLISLLITFLFITLSGFSNFEKVSSNKEKSYISYHMYHTLHEWDGVSKNVTCKLIFDNKTKDVKQVGVSAFVNSFDSGNSSRDSHALEVLEAIKYPKVTFLSNKIEQKNENSYEISGKLNFHGIEKNITFLVTKTQKENEINILGGFDVNLTDYNITRPTFMLVPVRDEINIKFNIVFENNK